MNDAISTGPVDAHGEPLVPEFGHRLPGRVYQPRPSVYAVVIGATRRVAVVRTSTGGHALPGGGIERGETPEAALAREVREECGCGIRIQEKVADAVEYVDAGKEGCFSKHSTFYCCEFLDRPRFSTSGAHSLLWLTADESMDRLNHESHRWIVRQVLSKLEMGSAAGFRYFVLHTARLGFRHWRDDDTELAWELWGDPKVTAFIGGPFTIDAVRERLRVEIERGQSCGLQYWPIFLLATGEHVGCCGLRPYEPEANVLELGFHIRSAHWSKGYALEAARAVINLAFRSLGATALFAGHHPANDASRRVMQRLGFAYTRDELHAPTGLLHPSYLLGRGRFEADMMLPESGGSR